MGVVRRLAVDRANQVDLFRGVGDVVLTPDDVADAVPDVLHRRGEVVRRPPVGTDEHEILELLVRELDVPADGVLPRGHALVGHPEPDRAFVLVGLARGHEPARQLGAVRHPVELEGDVTVPVEA